MTIVPRSNEGAPRVLVTPRPPRTTMVDAIRAGGGILVDDPAEAEALIWTDPQDPSRLAATLRAGPGIDWIQLPFAGIEPFRGHLAADRVWTSGKGVYAEPVAEMVLALLLAQFRGLPGYARARSWSDPVGRNLTGAHVVVLGGGEITRSLLPLLEPFSCRVTVLRRRPEPFEGAQRTSTLADLHTTLADADAVVIALALTPETHHVIDAGALAVMQRNAVIVNVGRGGHIDTDALTDSLAVGAIGGAALDVTDPEPLPATHPLWKEPRCLITPHIGNTPEMGIPLLEARVRENVARFADGRPLLGPVDVDAGY